MIALLILGCASEEHYPDYHTDLYEICIEDSWSCDTAIQTYLNDEEGISLIGMRWLILESDPWLTNMVISNISSITTDCPPNGSAKAYRSQGFFNPIKGRVCVVDTGRMDYMLTAAETLVHEAGHGRPNDPGHIICGPEAPPSDRGREICDPNYNGALGAELKFWESMTLQPEPIRTVAERKVSLTLTLIQEH